MGFWRSLAGTVSVELTSADPAGALTAINRSGIALFQTGKTGDLTVEFLIYRKDYGALSQIARRRGERLRILRRGGIYWTVKGLLHRPVLLAGMGILLALALFLPTRIFFVRVEGNVTVPTRLILAQAEECGIGFGASRRAVRSEQMKNALLAAIPELQWAGVNTSGCVATISVRERTVVEEQQTPSGVSSIVAIRDGVIRECTVLRGNALCKVGQAVKAGEVLVSGYTDCGITIQATQAQAEIYAETQRELTVITPSECLVRGESVAMEKKYSLIIGKKRINFYKDSGISDSSCVKMYSQSFVTLPGGFRLPLAIVTEEWIYYDSGTAPVAQTDALDSMRQFADAYLLQQMVAGQILDARQFPEPEDGACRLTCQYACLEMIGRVQSEEIIQGNGKND